MSHSVLNLFLILVKHICSHHCKGSTQAVQCGRDQYQCHRHFGGKPFWSPSSNHLSSKINFIQWSPIWSQQRFTRQGRERYLAEFRDLQVLLLHQCWVLSFWRAGELSLCCNIDSHSFPVRNVWWSLQVGPMTGFRLEDLIIRQLDMFLEKSQKLCISLLYSVGKNLSQHKSPAWTEKWQIIYWGKYCSSWTCWILRRARTWATMFRMGSGIWWGAKFSQLICWTCGLSTCATETWYFKSSNFDSDCVIRWLLKWRGTLFTTRVVSLLTIVSVFSFLLRIHILPFSF